MWLHGGLPGTRFNINDLPGKTILNVPLGAAGIIINPGFVNQREAMPGPGPEAEVLGPVPGWPWSSTHWVAVGKPLPISGLSARPVWWLLRPENLGSIFLVLLLPPASSSANTEHFGKSGQLPAV